MSSAAWMACAISPPGSFRWARVRAPSTLRWSNPIASRRWPSGHPDLQERELIKLQKLAGAIEGALLRRGVTENAAILAAQAGVTVFHVAFARWVRQGDPAAFRRLMDESLEELRSVTAAGSSSATPAAPTVPRTQEPAAEGS